MSAGVSRHEVEAMIASAQGAVRVKLQGNDPQTISVPGGTTRIIAELAPPPSLNVIDGVKVGASRPPLGYEVTLEEAIPEWDGETGWPIWPPSQDSDELLGLQLWPYSKAQAQAQLRATDPAGFNRRVEGALMIHYYAPAVARLVYHDGFWVLTLREDS